MQLRYYPLLDILNFNFCNKKSKNIVIMCRNGENWMFYSNYGVLGSMLRAFQVFTYSVLTAFPGGRCCYFIRDEILNQKEGDLGFEYVCPVAEIKVLTHRLCCPRNHLVIWGKGFKYSDCFWLWWGHLWETKKKKEKNIPAHYLFWILCWTNQ